MGPLLWILKYNLSIGQRVGGFFWRELLVSLIFNDVLCLMFNRHWNFIWLSDEDDKIVPHLNDRRVTR